MLDFFVIYCCPLNYALSQFLWFDKLTNQTKKCASALNMHLFFYKYVTSPRLLNFSQCKQTYFVGHVTI